MVESVRGRSGGGGRRQARGMGIAMLAGLAIPGGAVACGDAEPQAPAEDSAVPSPEATATDPDAVPGEADAWPETPPDSYWLLTEFDWGDDREVVYESTRFDPYFNCHRKFRGICALTQVKVEGEDLLAQFQFNRSDRLFQVLFLTPDLDREQAEEHGPRIWEELRRYATLHLGEPESAEPLPELGSLAVGPPTITHLWQRRGMRARLAVGRRDDDAFYVGAYFSDPEQPQAWDLYLKDLSISDAKLRRSRAESAPRESVGD